MGLPTALLVGLAGTALFASPASAAADTANLVVEVTANRNILSTSGWSSVDVFVRNDGSVPAAGVTVAFTLPSGLRTSSMESTSDWDCDWASPVTTCTRIGDFAPGASGRVLHQTVAVEGVQAGTALTVGATATTSTPESLTADNAASRVIRVVATGEIRGTLWNDLNADGIRQAGEPRADVGLGYRSQDDEDGSGFANNHDGTYSFQVPSKRYKLTTDLMRHNWRFTKADVGSDSTDSDLRLVSENAYSRIGESAVFTVNPAKPTVLDLGVVASFRPTKISPASALTGTTALVTLTGEGFSDGLEVKLARAGVSPIAGTVTGVSADRRSMTVSFPLAQAAAGAWTLVLDRQYGPHAEVANGFTVTLPPVKAVTAPSISGTVAVGSTVKAAPGTWNPAATSYRYQWAANGVAIRGATGAALLIPASVVGKRLSVKVTAARSGYTAASATSAATAFVAKGKAPAATTKPKITGTAKVGKKVKVSVGAWSPKADAYRYEWRLNGKLIRGATGATLKLKASMRGKKLTVTVIAVKAGHLDGKAKSKAVKIKK
ncbi:SdrD B-like domain-containing protein [Actinoplanes sp. NPDC024001]|uniref:SdrD B-like domain-containing protein n=1 Tax=Actinoplanes sp. NPDC024001 TaxID=3154598 RepID=UPI0033EEE7D7